MDEGEKRLSDTLAGPERMALSLAMQALGGDAVVVNRSGQVVTRLADRGPLIGTDWLSLWDDQDRDQIASALTSDPRKTISLTPRPQGQGDAVRIWVRPQAEGDALVLTEGRSPDAVSEEDTRTVRESLHAINNLLSVLDASSRVIRRSVSDSNLQMVLRVLEETDGSIRKAKEAVTRLQEVAARRVPGISPPAPDDAEPEA